MRRSRFVCVAATPFVCLILVTCGWADDAASVPLVAPKGYLYDAVTPWDRPDAGQSLNSLKQTLRQPRFSFQPVNERTEEATITPLVLPVSPLSEPGWFDNLLPKLPE